MPQTMRTHQGRQQIVAVGDYAYLAPEGRVLVVGDEVLLPGNWFDPKARWAKVTGMGTSYTGPLVEVADVR